MSLRNFYAAFAIVVGAVGLLLDFWVIAGTMVASAANPVARSLRGDPEKRTCPTWHGGVAHQPSA